MNPTRGPILPLPLETIYALTPCVFQISLYKKPPRYPIPSIFLPEERGTRMLGSLYIFTWSEMLLITRIYRIARSMELEWWNQRDRSFDSNIRSNRHCEKSGLGRSKWRREGRRISLEGEEGVSLPEIGSRFSAKRKKGEDSWGTLKNELVAATNNVACATGDR